MEDYIVIGMQEVLKMFAKCVVRHLIKPKKCWIKETVLMAKLNIDFWIKEE